MPRPFDGASGATSRFDFAHRRRLGIDTERSRSVNGTVGQTGTDPNALAESGKKDFQWRHWESKLSPWTRNFR